MNKRILLVSDTKNWGGWKRAQMIKKYLSDEYDFSLMDAEEYNNYERITTKNVFNSKDLNQYINLGLHGNDKDFIDVNDFTKWINSNKKNHKFDLIYFLFHTMLIKKSVKRALARGQKAITMVTVFPVLRLAFMKSGGESSKTYEMAKTKFLDQARKCKAVLANNRLSLEDLKKIYNGPIFLAPRGVDPDIFYPTSKEFKEKSESEFTVAFCGKANPEKGLESIIKPACIEAGVKLITNERNFENALPEHEMRNFYNSADAYIVASKMDGTPNTALEAAACGKAILTNPIGNMPEFIEKGKNGFLVPDLKLRRYVNKLRHMKKNQKKVYMMGKNARQTILDDWTWLQVLNKNERVIFGKVINGM